MEFSSIRSQTLTPERFLQALNDPETTTRIAGLSQSTTYSGWEIQRRIIPEHLVYLVRERGVEGRVGGKPVRVEPGTFFWVMPGAVHELRIVPPAKSFTLYYMKLLLHRKGDAKMLRIAPDFVLQRSAEILQSYFQGLVDEAHAPMAFGEMRRRCLLTLLFSGALRLGADPEREGAVFDDRQRRMLSEYIQNHISVRPSPADLARELRLNPDYFARVFRRTFGLSPRAWILRERIRVAAMRLSDSNLGVSELAYALGYKDVFLFSRQFKQVFGRSPRAYRRGT